MRIAACFSGNPRTFHYCYPYINSFFHRLNVDWYVHAWPHDVVAYDGIGLSGIVANDVPLESAEMERKALIRFKEYCFIRLIPMYWGISQAISLVDHSQYDLIIRIRPDVVPHQGLLNALPFLDVNSISFAYHMQDSIDCWSPPKPPHGLSELSSSGYNDLLFLGHPRLMKKFSDSFYWISEFLEDDSVTHFTATQLLKFFLDKKIGVRGIRGPLSLYLVGEEHINFGIDKYRKVDRSRRRMVQDISYIGNKFPDLVDFSRRKINYTKEELWLEKCWSYDQENPSRLIGYNI